MARINEEFGKAVAEELRNRGWSHQRACVATGIPGATIGRMALGIVPGEDHIIKWATALNEPINEWLTRAGYDPIPENLIVPRTSVPPNVLKSIEKAPTREAKIQAAFDYVRASMPGQFGSAWMSKSPTEAKLGIVRLYEELKHVRLLPDEIGY